MHLTKKWIFYLHNLFEEHHYAIRAAVKHMARAGVVYQFVAKRVFVQYSASIDLSHAQSISNIPCDESFWTQLDGLHVVFDGKPSLALCALANVYGIPYVITFHGGYDTNQKIYLPNIKDQVVYLSNQSKVVTVVGQQDQQALLGLGVAMDKIQIVPPTISLDLLPQGVAEKHRNRITVVGRFVEKKGIDVAIKALALLPDEYCLDIVGNGQLEAAYKHLARQCGVDHRITWHGALPLEKTLDIIHGNLLFWHPSKKAADGNAEGIPQVLLYAMAVQSYIIASDCGSVKDALQHLQTGILVPQNDETALAQATLAHLHQAKWLAANAQREANNFALATQSKTWGNIYGI